MKQFIATYLHIYLHASMKQFIATYLHASMKQFICNLFTYIKETIYLQSIYIYIYTHQRNNLLQPIYTHQRNNLFDKM